MTDDAENPAAPLLRDYPSPEGIFDEMLTSGKTPRPHWTSLVSAFERLGKSELVTRRDTSARLLRENGVTYNIYGDSHGLSRAWSLDLVPLVIPHDEWRSIETGLAQRSRLLNLILADLYGAQKLLREGVLPPGLIFANPAFLRQCHGIMPPENQFLHLHAVDLARAPNGRWWVLSDRTQAPSGTGYALENRIVLSRVLPEEFRELRAERLAHFFQHLRDTLRRLPAHGGGQPNVVLLTPGPYNETYSEHVYLARYLGFPLVEGTDLTVRDQRVFLKTLEGLQPVDVIIRRSDDAFCDPLELRSDSILGVPGLVEASRAGNVVVANALGSGVVETPALSAFLPGLCQQLLGEELKLPSLATWWCGQEKEFAYVRENIDRLVIKPAFARGVGGPYFAETMGKKERAALLTQMEATPYNFVAQERISLSTAPVFERGGLVPRPVVLRTFTCATREGYEVMPGGLSRFSNSPDQLIVSMQNGGGSKDTWVIGEGPVSQLSLLLPTTPIVRLERAAAEVPSRVADNLYWLGRYAERLEDTLRLLRCTLVRLAGDVGIEDTPELTALVRLLAHLDFFPETFRERHTSTAVEREVFQLIYRTNRLGTVRELQGRLSNIAFTLRDRFTADTWRILNKLQTDTRPRPGRVPIAEMVSLLDASIIDLAAFAGMEMENMTRGHGWRFLDIGRRIERAANMGSLVKAALTVQATGLETLEPVLEIADSVMTYRRRYFSQPQWPPALDLLLADESNPRSLAFQIFALSDHAANLPQDRNQNTRLTYALSTLLAKADWPSLVHDQLTTGNNKISELLTSVATGLRGFSDSLTHQYFSHATTRVS
ncbi:MAG: circularly permuted type 2 ATP-grasp protein [Verrucomicrobia bacterium]|nr:circularly permuted type 2 ATP-grasp protein [Verrucomicrobiota bacterium]